MPQLASTSLAASADPSQILPTAIRWSDAIAARPVAPPVIAGSMIVVALQSGTVVARLVADGKEAWRVELSADQPLTADAERVFAAAGEMIHALNAATGALAWRAPSGTLTAPLLVHEGWVVAATAKGLAAYRAADGSKVWSRESGAQRSRASIEGDNLYVPLEDGRLLALDLRTGTERWVHPFAEAPAEVLAFADRLYLGVGDEYFYCLDAETGATSWRYPTGSALLGRPAADKARVFVVGLDNMVRGFDRRTGAAWRARTPYRPTTGPVVVGSSVVVPGTETELRAFDAASGRQNGQIKLEERPAVPPAFGESAGLVVMAAVTGSLTGQWKLALLGPPAMVVPIDPLTELPGIIVPVEPPPS